MRAACALVMAAMAWTACSSAGSRYDELVVQTISAQWPGTPLEGIRVQVDDSAWASTDAHGNATFRNVGRPFTVRTYMTYQGAALYHRVAEVDGLDANPAVVPLDNLHYDSNEATIAGVVTNLSGSAASLVQVIAAKPGGSLWRAQVARDGSFQVQVHWEGPSTNSLAVHAFESDTANPPTHYLGYGSLTLPVSNGVAVTGLTVPLGPVAEAHVAGNLEIAGALGEGTYLLGLWLKFPDESAVPLVRSPAGGRAGVSGPFDHVVPMVGAPLSVSFSFFGGNTGISAGERQRVEVGGGAPATGLAFEVGVPVSFVEPAAGAPIGTGTSFRWAAGPDGANYDLLVLCQDTVGLDRRALWWEIRTSATQARLPSVPFFATAVGAACDWQVSWQKFPLPVADVLPPGRWSDSALRTAVWQ